MRDTPGKGPFAQRARTAASASRWVAPPVELSESNILELLRYVQRKNDVATLRILQGLASLRPEYRMARNISSLVRCMAQRNVVDALQSGLSDNEVGVLANLEHWGAPIGMLGVAHALMNVRERQDWVVATGDMFAKARFARGQVVDVARIERDKAERPESD